VTRAPLLSRLALAVIGGLSLWLAFPDHNLWWLAPVGVALLGAATLTLTAGRAFVVGLVAGEAFFLPTLSWSGIYVGKLPWFALATLEALYIAAMSAVVAYAGRRLVAAGRLSGAYAVIPLGWVAQELARGSTPFGGFPWARLAFSQADSPLARVAAYLGAPGVSAAVAVVGVALLMLGRALLRGADGRRHGAAVATGLALAVVLPLGSAAIPLPTDGTRITVALVQGDVPQPGLDFNSERRAVLDNHVRGTLALAARHVPDLSLVIWPENSSDIDPLRNPDAADQVQRALAAVGTPLLIGAVLDEPSPDVSNASLFYRPGSSTPERYVKLHPVPFAEYIPYKSFFRMFSNKVDLVRRPFVAGHTVGGFKVDSSEGTYWALPTICFEVAYDSLVRNAVTQPGREPGLLVVQTNNATFGYSDESEQQLAISRIRAIEHGRSVAHVSTVGVSAFIAPDGSVSGKTGLFTPAQVVGHPVIRSAETVSDRLGTLPEILTVLALGALVVLAHRLGRRARVVAPAPQPPPAREKKDTPVA
jgi:apolipoprotein N-acyltransferase